MGTSIRWKKIVERTETTLTDHMVISGHLKTPNILGVQFIPNCMNQNAKGQASVYFDEKSLKQQAQIITQRIQIDKNFLNDLLKKGYLQCNRFVEVAAELSKLSVKCANAELAKRLKQYFDEFSLYGPYLNVTFPIEVYLTSQINQYLSSIFSSASEQERQKYFSILATSQRESDTYLEQKDLLEIAILRKQGMNVEERLKVHAKRFGYMSLTNSFLSEPADKQDYVDELSEIENPEAMLKDLESNRTKTKTDYEKFTEKLSLELIKAAELLQEYMFFRAYRMDAMKKAQQNIKPLLIEISRRFGLKFEDIVWFTCPEIAELLEAGKVPNFVPRKEHFIVKVVGGKVICDSKLMREKKIEQVKVISGRTACSGFAKGKVRIVKTKKDMQEFQDGEIMVTRMTTPDFVIIMRKAAAIVTDEGGVLCHAAIVSREFNVPCVIGTKIATEVLKNGDMVEVDANKGVIKKLSS